MGLFGFILVLAAYIASEIVVAIMQKIKLNKYIVYGTVVGIMVVGIIIGVVRFSHIYKKRTFGRYRRQHSRPR